MFENHRPRGGPKCAPTYPKIDLDNALLGLEGLSTVLTDLTTEPMPCEARWLAVSILLGFADAELHAAKRAWAQLNGEES